MNGQLYLPLESFFSVSSLFCQCQMFSLERDEEMRRLTQESHRLVMTSVNSKLVSGSGAPPNEVSTLT